MVHGKDTEMMVSVIMITYGHEKYIEEAINGVFIQQTDFPVELIIANDCSPDQTDEVVKSLLRRAPENITVRYTKHQTNKGMNANFLWAASQATGKYIALCEGDDYWTDPLKLQKQVDFLEENEEYSAVISDRITKYIENGKESYSNNALITTTDHILYGAVMPTQCLVFRNIIDYKDFMPFLNHMAGDRILSYMLSKRGPIYCLKEPMAVYNYTGNGVWSKLSNLNQHILNASSLMEFHDLIGLPRGNKYIIRRLHSVIYESNFRKNKGSYEDLKKKFDITSYHLLRIKVLNLFLVLSKPLLKFLR